ncbi:MAG: dockerin, partial [Oscillospiraceae bacterium]|nr:dockerin [Oscillospiraceae bacterium]
GSVSIADAVLLVRWLAEEHDSIIAGDRLRMADLNGDGVLTALDSTLLMRMLL